MKEHRRVSVVENFFEINGFMMICSVHAGWIMLGYVTKATINFDEVMFLSESIEGGH